MLLLLYPQHAPAMQLDRLTVHCAMSMVVSVLAMCTLVVCSVDIAHQGIITSHQVDVKVLFTFFLLFVVSVV